MPERGDPFPHVRSRIRIGFGQAPEQAGDGAPAEARRGFQLADCNLTARGDESFAYDLVVRPGRVSSRVALLLRGAERKPAPVRFVRGEATPKRVPLPLPSLSDPISGGREPLAGSDGGARGDGRRDPSPRLAVASRGGRWDGGEGGRWRAKRWREEEGGGRRGRVAWAKEGSADGCPASSHVPTSPPRARSITG